MISPRYQSNRQQRRQRLEPAPASAPDANGNVIGGRGNGQINPLLAPLANNGGPTRHMQLLPNSPAFNAGDPAVLAGVGGVPLYDQRGRTVHARFWWTDRYRRV